MQGMKLSLKLSLIMAVILVASLILFAQKPCKRAEFSAVRTTVMLDKQDKGRMTPQQNVMLVERLYVREGSERSEWLELRPGKPGNPQYSGKVTHVAIHNWKQKVLWQINPQGKTYTETRLPASGGGHGYDSMKLVGLEKIEGYSCEKREQVYHLGSQKMKMTAWWCPKLHYPLETVTETIGQGATQWELRNIKEGKQADALFRLPKGLRKEKTMGKRGRVDE